MRLIDSPPPHRALHRTAGGLLCAAALFLAGCISESREQALGDEMAARLNAEIPLVHNALINRYVSGLGGTITSVSGRPERDYRFYIIDSAEVNAFALPGGHIYITRGLIRRTDSADELAGVLAHEIGHVVERHGVQQLQRHLRTGSVVRVLYQVILGGEPQILRQNALRLAGMLWSARHSREDEQEADDLAVEYLIRAGINPHGLVSLLRTLAEEEAADTSRVAGWFSTHPVTSERLRETIAEIEEEQAETAAGKTLELRSYHEFLQLLDDLPPPPDAERLRR